MAGRKRSVAEPTGQSSRKKSRIAPATRRATRSMTTDAARQAVFNTSELLEQIILYLPMKNIFGIQRVCKKFNGVIATSPEIRTKMFLRLRNDRPKATWVLDYPRGLPIRNPNDARFRKVEANEETGEREVYTPVALNPLFEPAPQDSPYRLRSRWMQTSLERYIAVKVTLSQGHLGSHPSFLKTYITDPPCQRADARLEAQYLIAPKEDSVQGIVTGVKVTSEQGLTIGDVVLAHGDCGVSFHATGLGGDYTTDGQLEEVSGEIGPMVIKDGLSPTLTLQLLGVVIPTGRVERCIFRAHGGVVLRARYQPSEMCH